MTMHVVLGDGQMKAKELHASLDEMWKSDTEADQDFWFLLLGKSDPTPTDLALVKWLNKNEIFYSVLTDDAGSMHDIYEPFQTFKAKSLANKVMALVAEEPEDDEEVNVMGLFVSDDADAEEDRWLNDTLQKLSDKEYVIRALNDGMVEVDFTEEEEPEEEPEPEEEEAKKPSKKKSAARKEEVEEVEVEDEDPVEAGESSFSRDDLEDMELDQLKKVAYSVGIELPPRTRATTYVDAILNADDEPGEEVSEVEYNAPVNEVLDTEAIIEEAVERAYKRVMESLAERFG